MHDPRRLPHFLDPDHEAVVAIAAWCRPECRTPSGRRLRRAATCGCPRGCRRRGSSGRRSPRRCASSLLTVPMSTLRCLKMRLSATRLIASSNSGRRLSSQSPMSVEQLQRHVLVDAAGRGSNWRASARPTRARRSCMRVFAHLEQPQVRRHRADVHDVAAEVEHVVRDAGQLGHQHADDTGRGAAPRGPSASRSRARSCAPCTSASSNRAGRSRAAPGVGLVLDQLLGAAVEQADMRVDPLDDLAVQLHDQAQHAVRGRMLRAEVDRVIAGSVSSPAVVSPASGAPTIDVEGLGHCFVPGLGSASRWPCRRHSSPWPRRACAPAFGRGIGGRAGAGLGRLVGRLGRRRRRGLGARP